jgi:hypothetical protein
VSLVARVVPQFHDAKLSAEIALRRVMSTHPGKERASCGSGVNPTSYMRGRWAHAPDGPGMHGNCWANRPRASGLRSS